MTFQNLSNIYGGQSIMANAFGNTGNSPITPTTIKNVVLDTDTGNLTAGTVYDKSALLTVVSGLGITATDLHSVDVDIRSLTGATPVAFEYGGTRAMYAGASESQSGTITNDGQTYSPIDDFKVTSTAGDSFKISLVVIV